MDFIKKFMYDLFFKTWAWLVQRHLKYQKTFYLYAIHSKSVYI